ncbi:MAG TPA: hypothetical protein VF178_04440 [Gemmatimonadaceae bacterium]
MRALVTVAGVQVRPMPGGAVVLTRSARGGWCQPFFFVDGRRSFLTTAELDWYYRSDEIAAVEVYPRPSMVPNDFIVPVGTCGAVAIWTRPPPSRIQRH